MNPNHAQHQEDLVLILVDARTDAASESAWRILDDIPGTPRFPTPDSIRKYVREVQILNSVSIELEEALALLKETLESAAEPASEVFKLIDKTLADLFTNRLKAALPEDSQIAAGLEDIFHRFTWKAVAPGSAASSVLRNKFCDMQHFRGELVRLYIEKNPHASEHLNPAALVEYSHFGNIADATNEFFLAWEKDAGGILSTEERKANGFTNELATIRYDEAGEPVEVLWHEAFPEEVDAIVGAYSDLIAELEEKFEDVDFPEEYFRLMGMKIEYYKAVLQGWKSSKLSDWREADVLLPQQTDGKNEPVHIHTIETSYGKDAMQRVPEVSLRCPDAAEASINDRAMITRATVATMAERFFRDSDFSEASKRTVELVKRSLFAARHFMGAGMEIVFMPAGQILPSEVASWIRGGVDISSNPKTMADRMVLIRDAFKIIFGFDLHEPDFVELNGGSIASHEFSHTIGFTANEHNIGGPLYLNFIEEWKATTGGLLFNRWMPFLAHREGWPEAAQVPHVTLKDLQDDIVHHIALCARYTVIRGESNNQPYMRKSYLLTNIAQAVSILYKKGDAWRIDVSEIGSIFAFFTALERQFRAVLKIYDTGTADDLRRFLAQYLKPTPFTEDVAAKLDAHYVKTDLPSVADLCRVP